MINTRYPPNYILVGFLIFSIYLIFLPFIARTWRTTGDEPHYLLTAHSLVMDGDLDLKNNYEQGDYLNFYLSRDITHQVRKDAAGREILGHYLGLPILITPAYFLGERFGVLLFQLILGAILAAFTFRLAFLICPNTTAALMATLFVALSPPLMMYNYLIYPEIIAALLTTIILYYAIKEDAPDYLTISLVWSSLLILPWFNRRFIPLALSLALLLIWAWRNRKQPLLKGILGGLNGVGLTFVFVSIGALFFFNSLLDAPERIDIALPQGGMSLWFRLIRGLGWLVDQQRGLFIFGPIYMAAIFGLPFLRGASQSRRWFIVWPFTLSLGTITLAGGYWVAWEVGPRFLVVALPALAPLLALAWQHYARSNIGKILISFLFILSLGNSLIIINNPELPYKSSLPLFYNNLMSLPLTDALPQLAENISISPHQNNTGSVEIINEAEQAIWFAEAGRVRDMVNTQPLYVLPYGHYNLNWSLRIDPNVPPETEILRLTATFLGGGQLFSHIIRAADLPSDGSYGEIELSFLNPNVDRWRTPPVLQAVSTGKSNLWAKEIALQADPFYAWVLPYFYLALLLLGLALAWWRYSHGEQVPLTQAKEISLPQPLASFPWRWAVLLLPIVAFGYVIIQINQNKRIYDMTQFYHISGVAIPDPADSDKQVWLVDSLTHHPGKAIYGPFDFYDPGQYEITFQMKLARPTDTQVEIALLQVKATSNFDEIITQPLLASHFTEANHYHQFVLTVNNPRRQALSFEVDYLGEAALILDDVMVEKIK